VLASILSSGRSSRFYDSLVRQQQLTSGLSASAADTRGPGLFSVGGTVLPGKSVADLEQAVYAEIEKIKNAPIAGWEMEKAINVWKRNYVAALSSSLQKAVQLGDYALRANDPNLINTYADRIAKVTAADVQRVAKKYLIQTNRSVIITNPKTAVPAPGGDGGVR
jgi:zinc protease